MPREDYSDGGGDGEGIERKGSGFRSLEGSVGQPSSRGRRSGESPFGFRRRLANLSQSLTNPLLPQEDVMEKLKRRQGPPENPRRFLLRLAVALHSYGSSAPRTEELIEHVGERIGVDVHISVFPSLITMAFPLEKGYEKQETHLMMVDQDLDVDKLDRADRLAKSVNSDDGHVLMAYWWLRKIATDPPRFGIPARLLSYAVLASTASLLFFQGTLTDALVCLILGLFIGAWDLLATTNQVVAEVENFVAALVVSFTARALVVSLPATWALCYTNISISALVWLLPGLSLTVATSELVAKSYVSGSSKFLAALFAAIQLGFGMEIGSRLVWWAGRNAGEECPESDMSIWWQILWFLGYTAASNVLLCARWAQWPGMTLVSALGWIAATVSTPLGGDASSIFAAFVIGVSGTLYSSATGDLPHAMKTSGILLLVPGGIGVQGVAAMLKNDPQTGMGFMFDMLVVGLSITLGLLMAKLALPIAYLGVKLRHSLHTKHSLAAQLDREKREVGTYSDNDDDEEAEVDVDADDSSAI
eukprot:TRINITY_DN282_c0_g1_i1.p1 TRINITY_DN282_c0_g1~~TRINITY_DN282_c0_g1_i1.p1  ORF type:complete len:532 (+),score=88.45 TRINITY_DN282_c0_g1_i1:203-1798(+)